MRKHFVTFVSPGTMFSEETRQPISAWNPKIAAEMARGITERHGAKPYGFRFSTCLAHEPVPDGEGGTLEVLSRKVAESGIYFLGGELRTIDHVRKVANPKEEILLSNMEANNWAIIIENTNSYKSTHPFNEEDFVIDPETGEERLCGTLASFVEYRAEKLAERKRKTDEYIASLNTKRKRP